MLRTLTLFIGALFVSTLSLAQWLPYNSGLQSNKSMTTHNGALYVASYPYGIFRTTNDGATWEAMNTGLPVDVVDELEFIYAESVGSNGDFLFAGTASGIYRSADDGATWTLANGPLTANNSVYANKWFKSGNTMLAIFAGTIANGGGIFATSNNGNTWIQGANGLSTNMTVYQIASIDGALYAATSAGLYKSVNNAQNWQPVTGSNFTMYAVQGTADRMVIISDFGYRYSNNDGASWTNATGAPVATATAQLILYDGKYFAITGGNSGVLRSINGGQTWSAYNTGLVDFDAISQEEFHASGNRLYLGALFDVYAVEGTTVAVDELVPSALGSIHPSVVTDGFNVQLATPRADATLVVIDAMGREVVKQRMLPVEKQWLSVEGIVPGVYRAQLRTAVDGGAHFLGTFIVE
jgi:photosystem II stability/assembly factor-like uncharacterized protein